MGACAIPVPLKNIDAAWLSSRMVAQA